MKNLIIILVSIFVFNIPVGGQEVPFSIDKYNEFQENHPDMSTADLLKMYPPGFFMETVPVFELDQVNGFNELDAHFNFTGDEISLLKKNGFMVTERVGTNTIVEQFVDIYKADLPVFVSSDAILHAFHESYDYILESVESNYLIDQLIELLMGMHQQISNLNAKYYNEPLIVKSLKDLDLYLSVPLRLLKARFELNFDDTKLKLDEVTKLILNEEPESIKLFSDNCTRLVDFSQFTPRGHYSEFPPLTNYFKAMIWLGRTELYLNPPSPEACDCPEIYLNEDTRRQIITTFLINEMMHSEKLKNQYNEIENFISAFVGEQDNVSLEHLDELFRKTGILEARDLLKDEKIEELREFLLTQPWAKQQILSQMLKGSGEGPVEPAIAFMLFGQRFVIDSYVTGQVVYDRIKFQGTEPCRLYPSTLDVLFTLGNNSSTYLLLDELEKYNYATNLAGLRNLISGYTSESWNTSIYNSWLHAIQVLSSDPSTENLPYFMKTGAWGLEKMNTQLSSWTELRHDNILYSKQSYTGMGLCSYPDGYVEPVPEFYQTMKDLCTMAASKFNGIPAAYGHMAKVDEYFQFFAAICDTLGSISEKELQNISLDNNDLDFINRMCNDIAGCGYSVYNIGWYSYLYYKWFDQEDYTSSPFKPNLLVADYHTTPTDCYGTMIGDISHAGTGFPDLIVVTVQMPDGNYQAFAGPVMSYHEYVTHDFKRLTDEEWKLTFLDKSLRPEWVYGYLADGSGNANSTSLKLFSSNEELSEKLGQQINITFSLENEVKLSTNMYPNPVRESMVITINVNHEQSGLPLKMEILNLSGQVIDRVCDERLIAGNHLFRWENPGLPPGIYFLRSISGKSISAERFIICE